MLLSVHFCCCMLTPLSLCAQIHGTNPQNLIEKVRGYQAASSQPGEVHCIGHACARGMLARGDWERDCGTCFSHVVMHHLQNACSMFQIAVCFRSIP